MLCRLCLCDLDEFVSIFSDNSKIAEHELPKVIAKYFQLEVTTADPVSTNLCTICWNYLSDFEQFCAMVADKQQALQLKTEPPEPGIVVWNTESPIETKLDDDIKDHILCEPEIDDNFGNDENDGSSSDEDCNRFGSDAEPEPVEVQRPLRKTKAKVITKKYTTTTTTQRASRALTREMKRQEAASSPVAEASTEAQLVVAKAKRGRPANVSLVAKPKRGRPKGPRQPKSPKVADPELSAKRSTIKDLDAFIAANVKMDCCICAASLLDFNDLKRHFRVEHNCTGYMQCCNNRYKKRTLYVDHLRCHRDPDYFSCKPCRKRFLNRNSQDMHMLRFHSQQQELVHQCGICQARFAKKFLLTMHEKGHKGTDRPEACETCQKTFRTKLELAAHVKRMHAADFTPIICDICGANFRSKGNFLIHKKALHPEGPVAEVQCHLCGRWLRDDRSLRKHLARHDDREGNNKYRCKLCGAEKASRVALGSHMRYHHSNKRHQCSLCSKEFKLSRALAEHMATHTGIDLYSCQFCTRTFKSHANMHNHKKKMHPNEWVRKYTRPSGVGVNPSLIEAGDADAAAMELGENEDGESQPVVAGVEQEEQQQSHAAADAMVYDIINLSACAS